MGNTPTTEFENNSIKKCLICKKKSGCIYCNDCEVIIMEIKRHPDDVSKNTQLILDKMYIDEYVKNIGNMKCRVCHITSRDILFNNHCLLCGVTKRLNEISDVIFDEHDNVKLVYNTSVNKIVRLKMPFDFHTVLPAY